VDIANSSSLIASCAASLRMSWSMGGGAEDRLAGRQTKSSDGSDAATETGGGGGGPAARGAGMASESLIGRGIKERRRERGDSRLMFGC
jgi:hypothetical protein